MSMNSVRNLLVERAVNMRLSILMDKFIIMHLFVICNYDAMSATESSNQSSQPMMILLTLRLNLSFLNGCAVFVSLVLCILWHSKIKIKPLSSS